MIDTDKYEGRSKRRAWRTSSGEPYTELYYLKENDECNEVDVQVLADAPLLLAEVKRLRKQLGAYMRFQLWVQEEHNEIHDSYEDVDEL
mgnify:CR=1 FL=1